MVAFTTLISRVKASQDISKVRITIIRVAIVIITSTGMARLQ
jgi:2-methylcitrate dehydratase PrpD